MMKFNVVAGACLLASATSVVAQSRSDFEACDGYGSPTGNGDGMTREATGLFGLIAVLGSSGNTRRSTPDLGAGGVNACDRALADPRLVDKHWLRKASLLRARAIQNLAAARTDQTIADLDRAATATRLPDDPFIKRSMMLGIDVVRGYALAQKGDSAAGRKMVILAQRQRPFDRALGLAIMVLLLDDESGGEGLQSIHSVARLDPRMIDLVFQMAFERGNFQQAIEIYPQIRPMTRNGDIGISRAERNVQDFKKDLEEIRFSINRAGQLAYAHAALGQAVEAKSAIERGRAALAAAIPAPMQPLAAGEKEGSRRQLDRIIGGQLVKAGLIGADHLTTWSTLAVLRLEAAALPAPDAKARISQARIPKDGGLGVTLDLTKLLRTKDPQDQKIATTLAEFEVARAAPSPITESDARLVFNALPHTEIAKRVASFRKSNAAFGYLWEGVSGFKTTANKADPTRATISFANAKSSSSVVQEMALLRAADYARERGKSGFVIHDRSDYERTVTTTYYGAKLRSDPNGYSASLEIEMVDLDRLPDRLKNAPWRAIPAAEVIAQLGPIYLAAPTDTAN